MRLDQARSYAVQQPYISTLHMFLKNRAPLAVSGAGWHLALTEVIKCFN